MQLHALVSRLNVPVGRRHVQITHRDAGIGDVGIDPVIVVICNRVVKALELEVQKSKFKQI